MKLSETSLLPLAGIALLLGCTVSIITALATADWRYLLISVGCYILIAAK